MRSKQINYRNRAAGFSVTNVQKVTEKPIKSNSQNFGTQSANLVKVPAIATDKAAAVTTKALATPADDAAADAPVVDVSTLTKKNEAVADVPAEGSAAPMAAGGAPETEAPTQPETNKTVNRRTWIIAGIAALILLYLYRKK